MRAFIITELEANQRFDKYLRKFFKNTGSGYVYKMLRKGTIKLNGKKVKGNEIIKAGDEVRMYMTDETIDEYTGKYQEAVPEFREYKQAYKKYKERIEIIYEDKHILLINKPIGILSQKAEKTDVSCNEWLIGYMLRTEAITPQQLQTFKPSICNRLDRNTSGILICGKTLAGSQKMNELIKERKIRKFYRTFVKGCFDQEVRTSGYLKKDYFTNKVTVSETVTDGSERIETVFTPIKWKENISYIEVELVTGKTHQIRAHIASLGHPVLGDYKYGDRKFNESETRKRHQLLHAYRLEMPYIDDDKFQHLSRKVFVAEEPIYYETIKARMKK